MTMKSEMLRTGSILLLTVLGLTATANSQASIPAIPPTPAPVLDVVSIQPFELETPVAHLWRAEKPMIRSGYLLVLKVDRVVDPRRPDYLDLSKELMWFGSPELPERVNTRRIAAEHKAAVAAGIKPFAGKKIVEARQRGGALNRQTGKRSLTHDAMRRLVLTYSPQERALVDGVLLDRPR